MKYQKIDFIDKLEAQEILDKSSDSEKIVVTLLRATYHVDDYPWINTMLKKLLLSDSVEVQRTAIICCGHVARFYKKIDHGIMEVLKKYPSDGKLKGYINETLSDIEIFCK